jgi:choline dehydrogenase-like flavoprotein
MAAWNLTQQGIDVLLLDVGDKFDRTKYLTHVQPWEARERAARGERPIQFVLDRKEQPYSTPWGRPFELTSVWGHGGKTNVWGRVRQLRRGLRHRVLLLFRRPPAAVCAETGRLELRSNAVVAGILTGKDGRASGVQYFDRSSGAERQVLGQVVAVGASCLDSTRILLNSESERHPNGLGNGRT